MDNNYLLCSHCFFFFFFFFPLVFGLLFFMFVCFFFNFFLFLLNKNCSGLRPGRPRCAGPAIATPSRSRTAAPAGAPATVPCPRSRWCLLLLRKKEKKTKRTTLIDSFRFRFVSFLLVTSGSNPENLFKKR